MCVRVLGSSDLVPFLPRLNTAVHTPRIMFENQWEGSRGEKDRIAATFEQGSKILAPNTCHITLINLVARETRILVITRYVNLKVQVLTEWVFGETKALSA